MNDCKNNIHIDNIYKLPSQWEEQKIKGEYIERSFPQGYNVARDSYTSVKCPSCDKNSRGIFLDCLLKVINSSSPSKFFV